MRFALIDAAKVEFPVYRMCRVLGVSQSGYFAWKDRPACRRQRQDMVLLGYVRSAFALSHGTYGSPRMTRELQGSGLAVGRQRTARLMRENGLRARQKRRFKRATDSHHAWPVTPICSIRTSPQRGPTRNGGPTFPTSGPAGNGSIWRSSSTCSHVGSYTGTCSRGAPQSTRHTLPGCRADPSF
jgi:putative transposase